MIKESICGAKAVDGFPHLVAEHAATATTYSDFLTQMIKPEETVGKLWRQASRLYVTLREQPSELNIVGGAYPADSPVRRLHEIASALSDIAKTAGVHCHQVAAMADAVATMIHWPNSTTNLDTDAGNAAVAKSLRLLSAAELLPSKLFQQVWHQCCTACDGGARVTSPSAMADVRFCGCVQAWSGFCSRCGQSMYLTNKATAALRSGEFNVHEASECENCGWRWGLDNGDQATR